MINLMELTGRNVMVTGAAQGIGLKAARLLYALGASTPGLHLLKLIATTEPIDVASAIAAVRQGPLRTVPTDAAIPSPILPLIKLLGAMTNGQETRSLQPAPDWGTSEAWLEIVP